MDNSKQVKVGDCIYYMRRSSRERVYKSDNDGEWLAGAGYIISISTKNGDRVFDKTDGVSVSDVEAIRVMPHNTDDDGHADPITVLVGEFTYNLQNFLSNLIS